MANISFTADTITIYRKKPILKTPIRYDTDNIGITDIIDDTNTIDPSLVQIKKYLPYQIPEYDAGQSF